MSNLEWYSIDTTDKGLTISIKVENMDEWSWYWLFQTNKYLIFSISNKKKDSPNPIALFSLF